MGSAAAHDIRIGDHILWGDNVIPNIGILNITVVTPTGETYTEEVLITIETTGGAAEAIWYRVENIQYIYTVPTYQDVSTDYFQPYGINYTITAYANNSWGTTFNDTVYWVAYATPINQTMTDNMNTLTSGKPFHAAKDAQEDVSDKFFFTFILAAVFVGMWQFL